MQLTKQQLKQIIKEELQKALSENTHDVPQEAKDKIFAKMVARGFAKEGDIAGAEFWEVQPKDYGYNSDIAVEIEGKRYYGEI